MLSVQLKLLCSLHRDGNACVESIAYLIGLEDRSGYHRLMKERGKEMGRSLSVDVRVHLGRRNFWLSVTQYRQLTME